MPSKKKFRISGSKHPLHPDSKRPNIALLKIRPLNNFVSRSFGQRERAASPAHLRFAPKGSAELLSRERPSNCTLGRPPRSQPIEERVAFRSPCAPRIEAPDGYRPI